MNEFEVVFVLPDEPFDYPHPPGGFMQIYRLAAGLSKRETPVAIIFPMSSLDTYGCGIHLREAGIIKSRTWDTHLLDDMFLFFGNKVHPPTKCVIATGWNTVDTAVAYAAEKGSRLGHYVQNFEDHPAFAGQCAAPAFKRIPDKFVVSPYLQERWPLSVVVPPIVPTTHHYSRGLKRDIDCLVHVSHASYKGAKWVESLIPRLRERGINCQGFGQGMDAPPQTNEELGCLFNRAKVMLIPSELEGASAWVVEGLLDGCRIVASSHGWGEVPDVASVPYMDSARTVEEVLSAMKAERILGLPKAGMEWAKQWTTDRAVDAFETWLGRSAHYIPYLP
jgi:hypothetical protein